MHDSDFQPQPSFTFKLVQISRQSKFYDILWVELKVAVVQ